MTTFRLGLTRDFLNPDGSISFGDIGLDVLGGAQDVDWEFLPELANPLRPEDVRDYDAIVVLSPQVTAATLAGTSRLKLVARFGVGIDNIDIPACTEAGVLLTITPDGVRRPVAAAAMAFVLGLAHRIRQKDRITREGLWDTRLEYMGDGLVGKTLGIVGYGNIGREIGRLARPFDLRVVAHDPLLATADVDLLPLDSLLETADFVVLTCPLNEHTRHLIDAAALHRMRPRAFLVNVARGPVVDEAALIAALRERAIAGAALDVFEQEPPAHDNPLLAMDNVIVAPHAAAWTDEVFRDNGRAAFASVLAVLDGRLPDNLVNRDVVDHPKVSAWLTGATAR